MSAFLVLAGSFVGFTILRGAAIQLGWHWFLAPVIPSLPASLSLADAIGVGMVIGLLTLHLYGADADASATDGKSLRERAATSVGRGVAYYIFYFVIALIVHGAQS